MRRSKIGIRRRRKKANIIIIILFLFILPIVAVVIGSKITEWWVMPTINTDNISKSPEETVSDEDDKKEDDTQGKADDTDKVKEEKTDGDIVNLNPISVHMIQIVSVSDKKNIELLIEELSDHNLPYITYKLDDAYKVYVFASTKRKDMENKIDKVREIYEDAYIGQINIPQRQIQYSAKENKGTKEIIEDMNLLLKLLEQSSDNLYKPDIEETKPDEYKGILENHQKLLGQILEKIGDTDLPKDFAKIDDIKKMVEYQEKNIVESLKIIEEGQELYKLQNYFLDNLFRTVEVIRK